MSRSVRHAPFTLAAGLRQVDPRSPVSCPGFPTLPVPDYVPRLIPLDPRSPVFCPGFPILPAPDYVLRPVPVDLLDECRGSKRLHGTAATPFNGILGSFYFKDYHQGELSLLAVPG
ncbi:unnamed protein product [Boreogadus saida]